MAAETEVYGAPVGEVPAWESNYEIGDAAGNSLSPVGAVLRGKLDGSDSWTMARA